MSNLIKFSIGDIEYCEDPLHLAVAMRSGAREIISDDKDFDGTQIIRIMQITSK